MAPHRQQDFLNEKHGVARCGGTLHDHFFSQTGEKWPVNGNSRLIYRDFLIVQRRKMKTRQAERPSTRHNVESRIAGRLSGKKIK